MCFNSTFQSEAGEDKHLPGPSSQNAAKFTQNYFQECLMQEPGVPRPQPPTAVVWQWGRQPEELNGVQSPTGEHLGGERCCRDAGPQESILGQ